MKYLIFFLFGFFFIQNAYSETDPTHPSPWDQIHVDMNGKVTYTNGVWSKTSDSTYTHLDNTVLNGNDIFYVNTANGKLKQYITINGTGKGTSFYMARSSTFSQNGSVDQHTVCVGSPADCITVNTNICSDLLKFVKMDSPEKLIAEQNECASLNQKKADFWNKIHSGNANLSKPVSIKVRALTNFDPKLESIPNELQDDAGIPVNYQQVIPSICQDYFWSKQAQTQKKPAPASTTK